MSIKEVLSAARRVRFCCPLDTQGLVSTASIKISIVPGATSIWPMFFHVSTAGAGQQRLQQGPVCAVPGAGRRPAESCRAACGESSSSSLPLTSLFPDSGGRTRRMCQLQRHAAELFANIPFMLRLIHLLLTQGPLDCRRPRDLWLIDAIRHSAGYQDRLPLILPGVHPISQCRR